MREHADRSALPQLFLNLADHLIVAFVGQILLQAAQAPRPPHRDDAGASRARPTLASFSQRSCSRSTSSGHRRGGCGPRLTNVDGRSGLITSSENGCRGSGSVSQARPMLARQFVGLHARADAGHQPRRPQPVGRLRHGVERIHRRHHQQLHRLAFLFRHLHHVAEQLLFVVAEDLRRRTDRIRRRRSKSGAPSSRRCRGAAGWFFRAPASGAPCDGNRARPPARSRDAHAGWRVDLRLMIQVELLQPLLLAVCLRRRLIFSEIVKIRNKHERERDAVLGGDLLW